VSAWITKSNIGKVTSFISSNWVKVFRGWLIIVTLQILVGKQYMMFASWEGGTCGRWPQEEYSKLVEVQEEMVAVLARVCDAEKT
jgi:hypothetical protein